MGCETRQVWHRRGDTDIYSRHIVANRWTPGDSDSLRNRIDGCGMAVDHPRARKAGKLHQIDVQLISRVITRGG